MFFLIIWQGIIYIDINIVLTSLVTYLIDWSNSFLFKVLIVCMLEMFACANNILHIDFSIIAVFMLTFFMRCKCESDPVNIMNNLFSVSM